MTGKPTLLIMAAGMGSRFGGLKQIEPISDKGEIILDFSLYDAIMAGFEKAVFIIKRENLSDFKALIDNKAAKHIDVEYVFQDIQDLPPGYHVPEGRVKPWGTGHAVLAAREVIKGPFAAINADDYYGPDAFHKAFDFLQHCDERDGAGLQKQTYAMIGYMIENTLTENGYVARGVCRASKEGILEQITERTKIKWDGDKIVYTPDEEKTWGEIEKGTPVSMNFWCYSQDFMRELEERFPRFLDDAIKNNPLKGEYFLPLVVDQLLKEQKAEVKILNSRDKWYGVTYREDKEDVVNALQAKKDNGEYPEELWK